MKTNVLFYLSSVVLSLCLSSQATAGVELTDLLSLLTSRIPARPSAAMTGSEFARSVSGMDGYRREQAIVSELLKGNLPDFLRILKPVHLISRAFGEKPVRAVVFTMPDYLAIGSEDDYLLIPMNLNSAVETALKFGFTLPTKKIVDAVYSQSDRHFTPQPLPAGPEMRSTEYYVKHNEKVGNQRKLLGIPLSSLVSGHKKDVVITNRLAYSREKVAIYGWHRPSGMPIQPLSTVHNAGYADYSHGIRLVSDTVLIDDEPQSIYSILQDRLRAGLLSDEGPVAVIRRFLPGSYAHLSN